MNSQLQPGKYFGQVDQHRAVGPFLLNRLMHRIPRDVPHHGHERAFVTLLVKGEYRESDGRRTIHFDPFSSVYHPPAYQHEDRIGSTGAEFFVVEFHPEAFLDAGGASVRRQSIRDLSGKPVTWTLLNMFREFACGGIDDISLEGYAWDLVSALANSSHTIRHSRRALKWTMEFIRENYTKNLTLKEVAAAADVHPVYLGEVFRREMGVTMGEYLNRIRVRQAAIALTDRARPITAVALDCGFYDQSHFTRVFKNITGLTPGRFRRLSC